MVYFFYVETKGPTLEEIAKIFDGDKAETGVADISEVKADMNAADAEKVGGTSTHVEKSG